MVQLAIVLLVSSLVDSQVDNNINLMYMDLALTYFIVKSLSYVDMKFGSIIGSELSYFRLMSGSGVAKNDTTYYSKQIY